MRYVSRNLIFVNDERTVMVEMWPDGTVVVATRDNPSQVWSPPVELKEDRYAAQRD